jgi:hypothetical protein
MTRCKICARKLDKQGNCTNKKCPEYTRAKIMQNAEAKAEADTEDNK